MMRREVELVEVDLVVVVAAQLDMDAASAVAVTQLDGPAVVCRPAVAPLHEGDEHRQQLGALAGEAVARPGSLTGFAVFVALEEAAFDELLEASGGDGFADAGAR